MAKRPTPRDVLDARRGFVYHYVSQARGFFPEGEPGAEQAEGVFDALAERGGFSNKFYRDLAQEMRRADNPPEDRPKEGPSEA